MYEPRPHYRWAQLQVHARAGQRRWSSSTPASSTGTGAHASRAVSPAEQQHAGDKRRCQRRDSRSTAARAAAHPPITRTGRAQAGHGHVVTTAVPCQAHWCDSRPGYTFAPNARVRTVRHTLLTPHTEHCTIRHEHRMPAMVLFTTGNGPCLSRRPGACRSAAGYHHTNGRAAHTLAPLDRRSAGRQVDQEPRDSRCNGQVRPLGPGERCCIALVGNAVPLARYSEAAPEAVCTAVRSVHACEWLVGPSAAVAEPP